MGHLADPTTMGPSQRVRVIFVVVPCLNERENLPGLFDGLRRHTRASEARIVFVDDGSSDGSGQLARELAEDIPLTLLTHEGNRGLGAAVASGLRYALDEGVDDEWSRRWSRTTRRISPTFRAWSSVSSAAPT